MNVMSKHYWTELNTHGCVKTCGSLVSHVDDMSSSGLVVREIDHQIVEVLWSMSPRGVSLWSVSSRMTSTTRSFPR